MLWDIWKSRFWNTIYCYCYKIPYTKSYLLKLTSCNTKLEAVHLGTFWNIYSCNIYDSQLEGGSLGTYKFRVETATNVFFSYYQSSKHIGEMLLFLPVYLVNNFLVHFFKVSNKNISWDNCFEIVVRKIKFLLDASNPV